MKMHHLLNATALALILGVAPVAAQQSQSESDAPQAQQEQQAKPGEAGKSDSMTSTDSEPSGSASDAGSDTAESDAAGTGDAGSDTAESGSDSMSSDSDTAAGDSMEEDQQQTGSIGQGDEEQAGAETQTGDAAGEQGSADAGATASAQGGEFINQQQQGELLASKLIGQPVVNANDEKIGDINDLLFSENNELVGVVIGVGGFLGIGEKAVAMSFDGLTVQQNEEGEDILVASMSQAQLEQAPDFQSLEDIELAQQEAQQQAAADREKATPGMAPDSGAGAGAGSQPQAMDEEPAPGGAPAGGSNPNQ